MACLEQPLAQAIGLALDLVAEGIALGVVGDGSQGCPKVGVLLDHTSKARHRDGRLQPGAGDRLGLCKVGLRFVAFRHQPQTERPFSFACASEERREP